MSDESQIAAVTPPDAGKLQSDEGSVREWPGPASLRTAGFQVVVRRSVLNDVHAHAHSSLDAEICGVMVGDVVRDDRGPFVYIEASIRGEFALSQSAAVTFTADTWTYMQDILDKQHPGKRIVGWYHSHPGFGIFLSEMDLFIHRHFFNLAWQVALVYDPIRSEEGMFIWRSGTPTRESFVVEEDTKIVEYRVQAATSDNAGPSLNRNPASPELLAFRSKVRWLSAGVILALVISVVWSVVLVVVSQRTPGARDIIRSLRWPGTSTKAVPEESEGAPDRQHSEHGEAPPRDVSESRLRLRDQSGLPITHGSGSRIPLRKMPASQGARSNE